MRIASSYVTLPRATVRTADMEGQTLKAMQADSKSCLPPPKYSEAALQAFPETASLFM